MSRYGSQRKQVTSSQEDRGANQDQIEGNASRTADQSSPRYGNADAAARLDRSNRGEERVACGQGELDRRTPESVEQTDGSGAWGVEEAGATDYANRAFWYQVANGAETVGLTNAARHMRHYLDNTGDTLNVDVNLCLRDCPSFEDRFAEEIAVAQGDAEEVLDKHDLTKASAFSLLGSRKNHYFQKSETQDWFFAVGGFTYWYTANVVYTPGEGGTAGQVEMEITLHLFDNYNWDQGKSVTIAGLTVEDEQMGRLHKVGLAKEYPISGTSSLRQRTWLVGEAPAGAASPSLGVERGEQARYGESGRADTGRDRR